MPVMQMRQRHEMGTGPAPWSRGALEPEKDQAETKLGNGVRNAQAMY